jgi:hypothetical protein
MGRVSAAGIWRPAVVPGLLLAALLVGTSPALGAEDAPAWFSQSGYPGALQTPTGFMAPEGTVAFGASATSPYNTLYLGLQPFDWLNFNARYVDVTDRPYRSSRTGQSYKDKSFDVALRLFGGSSLLPSVSLGIIDLGGTGLFASEYIVASQKFYDFYGSLGLGWGRLGSRGDFENPLIGVNDSFRVRPRFRGIENSGKVSYERWFRGEDVALFGSLIWNPTFLPSWSLMLEVEGNDYSREIARRPVSAPSRVNFGLSYALNDYASVGASYLRGDTFAFQVGVAPKMGSNEPSTRRRYLPELRRNANRTYQAPLPDDDAARLEQLYYALRYQGFFVHALDVDASGKVLTIWQSNSTTDDPVQVQQFVGRQAANYLPESVETIRVVTMAGGVEALRFESPRWLLEDEASGRATIEELILQSDLGPGQGWSLEDARYPNLLRYPTYSLGVNPALRSNIGGPADFFVGQFLLKPYATLQLTQSLSVTSTIAINVVSDLDRVRPVRSGSLPRVRSDLELYQSETGDVYLDELEANYFFPIASEWYGRVSAGIFESMFGGVAAEVLYRPFDARWALSLDTNYVRQRGYEQRFDFRDYTVATGHLTLYYRTPFEGVTVRTSVGRYLAKDVGATLDLSREFRNGARFGVYATKTDASSEEFGEGSFDKGFYVYFPLSGFAEGLKGSVVGLSYRFLARDGGQRVDDGRELYSVFGPHSAGAVHER